MRKGDRAFAVVLLLGGLLLIRQALHLRISWTAMGPGAGFFPFWLSVFVFLQAGIILVRSLRLAAPPGREAPFVDREAARPLLIAFLPIVAIIAMMRTLGVYLGGALYLAGYMIFVGRQRWPTVVLVSILLPLALFYIFERWFLLPLPKGALLEYLLFGR